jgi:hypothetical protein
LIVEGTHAERSFESEASDAGSASRWCVTTHAAGRSACYTLDESGDCGGRLDCNQSGTALEAHVSPDTVDAA